MRDPIIAQFLANTLWETATLTPIAGDASARHYFRLTQTGQAPAILMDDPTGNTKRFAEIAEFLTASGLAAPQILHHEPTVGMMIISDLGASDFAAHLRKTPQDETELYSAATKVLSQLHHQTTTMNLTIIDQNTAPEMIDLAALHYATTPAHKDDLRAAIHTAFCNHIDPTPHIALRDFHAENLIWRPTKTDQNRVGVLDFQDACLAPLGYDLMSLLRDARRDVDENVAQACIAQFCATINTTPNAMSAHLACVSVQRNLRILGIFARLAKQDGKVKYLPLLPRVWAHLMTDLAHPALSDLRNIVTSMLPPPDTATLQRLNP